jgi:hypothetical protein
MPRPARLLSLAFLLGACASSSALNSGSPSPASLPFIDDDYPRALVEARQRQLPLFVETWAPW